jgi:hypothetical protein
LNANMQTLPRLITLIEPDSGSSDRKIRVTEYVGAKLVLVSLIFSV